MFDIQARHASLVGVLRQIAAGTVSDPQSWAQRIVAGTEAQNCDPDVCAICGDIECDGVGCYANLDADDPRDHARIEQVQGWVRRGRRLTSTEEGT